MTDVDEDRRTAPAATRIAMSVLVLGVVLAAGLLGGWVLTRGSTTFPPEGSVDAGFSRDMQAHHRQAVQMSLLVLDGSQDEEVRTLATDILLTQQQQAGQMYGWLEQWGLPQSSPSPVMAWMQDGMGSHEGMDTGAGEMSMPGMASDSDLARLRAATGAEADRLYLQLMIPHHEGGVDMAQAAVRTASTDEVTQLATKIIDSQTAELTVLADMLDARGGPVG